MILQPGDSNLHLLASLSAVAIVSQKGPYLFEGSMKGLADALDGRSDGGNRR